MLFSSSSELRFCAGGLAGLGRLAGPDDLREHIGLTEGQVLLRTAVLGEDDLVALRQVHRNELSVVVPAARTYGEDLAALRLLLGRIRKHDAAEGLLLFFEDFDDQ